MRQAEMHPPNEPLLGVQQQIDVALGQLEQQLHGCVTEIAEILARLDAQRQQIDDAISERAITAAVRDDEATPAEDEISADLDHLSGWLRSQCARAGSLREQVTAFLQLLSACRRQFQLDGTFLAPDEVRQLAISQAVIHTQEDERRRLAREIHDGPAQVMANAILGLEFIGRSLKLGDGDSPARSVEEIERVKSSMRDGLSEIRRFMFDLRPAMLAQRGLLRTLEHYVESYRRLLPAEVTLELPNELPGLTAEQELTAFRFVQEGLQNVFRHGHASKTWVRLTVESYNLVVQVRDNGRGFRPEAVQMSASGGSGLTGMRERAEQIGGALSISSAPGQGTVLTLILPLAPPHPEPRALRASEPVPPFPQRRREHSLPVRVGPWTEVRAHVGSFPMAPANDRRYECTG